jgi:hypothetical protein
LFGPYTFVSFLTLGVYFIGMAGDHFTTGYIISTPEGGQEHSPLYRLLRDRITLQQFVNLSSVIKAVGGMFCFLVVPSLMIIPAFMVCTAPTFNMFWLWKDGRTRTNPTGSSGGWSLSGPTGINTASGSRVGEALQAEK